MTPQSLRLTQATIDFILILASFTLAYFLRVGFIFSTDFPFAQYAQVFIPTAIAWMAVLFFQRVYREKPTKKRRLFTNIMSANLVGITIFVLIFFYKRDIFFSRLMLVYVWAISSVLIISNAWIFRIYKNFIYKRGIGTKKVLIVGANKTAEEAIENIKKHEPYYEPVAVLDAYGTKKKDIAGIPVLGKMNSFEEVVTEKHIDVILQADCLEQSLNLVHFAEENRLDYFLVPSLLGAYHENVTGQAIGDKVFITLKH